VICDKPVPVLPVYGSGNVVIVPSYCICSYSDFNITRDTNAIFVKQTAIIEGFINVFVSYVGKLLNWLPSSASHDLLTMQIYACLTFMLPTGCQCSSFFAVCLKNGWIYFFTNLYRCASNGVQLIMLLILFPTYEVSVKVSFHEPRITGYNASLLLTFKLHLFLRFLFRNNTVFSDC
jgi:hypothetical protein